MIFYPDSCSCLPPLRRTQKSWVKRVVERRRLLLQLLYHQVGSSSYPYFSTVGGPDHAPPWKIQHVKAKKHLHKTSQTIRSSYQKKILPKKKVMSLELNQLNMLVLWNIWFRWFCDLPYVVVSCSNKVLKCRSRTAGSHQFNTVPLWYFLVVCIEL